jgi:hypothetical protein
VPKDLVEKQYGTIKQVQKSDLALERFVQSNLNLLGTPLLKVNETLIGV